MFAVMSNETKQCAAVDRLGDVDHVLRVHHAIAIIHEETITTAILHDDPRGTGECFL